MIMNLDTSDNEVVGYGTGNRGSISGRDVSSSAAMSRPDPEPFQLPIQSARWFLPRWLSHYTPALHFSNII
jgi:hypothetical protein